MTAPQALDRSDGQRRRPTVLVLRALGLGDFVTGLPALRVLREGMPGHRVVLAAPTVFAPLALATGLVDAVAPAHELEPIRDAPHGAELAIDLHGNGPASRALLEACEPQRVVAYSGGADGRAADARWRADEHEVARWCRLLDQALGLRADDATDTAPTVAGTLPVPDVSAPLTGATVLHCGAKAPGRRWPAARFAALAAELVGDGHRVVVTGGAGERATAEQIATAAGVPALTDLDLAQLLALVSSARVVVSGDTGVAHVAAAYRTPSVTLFGPVSPARWGPPPDPRHVVLWHGDGRGDPHAHELDPALARITVDEVLPAVAQATATAPLIGAPRG